MLKPLTPTQRDEFLDRAAMMAVTGIAGNVRFENVARVAWEYAEALLAERDRRTSKE